MKYFRLITLILICSTVGSFAVEPDEVLDDKELESRARHISTELRCLVCRNEDIDSSNADLARDLRILVRDRLVLGDTNDEVLNFIRLRYGDYVLLTPRFFGAGIILWLMGPCIFILGLLLVFSYIRKNKNGIELEQSKQKLTSAEQKALDVFLK